ncbi:MAG: hypothetical protein EA397_08010, partial [Deltaproteobacteria bacterium]
MMIVPIAQLTFDVGTLTVGLEPDIALQLRPTLWAALAGLFAALVLPRMIPVAVLFGLVALAGPLWPDLLPWTATSVVADPRARQAHARPP